MRQRAETIVKFFNVGRQAADFLAMIQERGLAGLALSWFWLDLAVGRAQNAFVIRRAGVA
jgi:hypothetical protein